ncbi:hypothetical protein F4803DRAFT_214519 [Xylaria telfairii]|nr:hypothetical protein F4803DRAFT_214519 [Xylaria telfairii]
MPPKTKKKGLEPSLDLLPGLFPSHDGSYGTNTLITPDVRSKKGHKSSKEQSDDQKWIKALKGSAGKKYGMNSNLKKAVDESHKEVEEEEHQGQDPISHNSSQSQSGNQPPSISSAGTTSLPEPAIFHSSSSSSSSSSVSSLYGFPGQPGLFDSSVPSGPSGPSGSSGSSSPEHGSDSLGNGPGGPGKSGKPSRPPDDSGFIPSLSPYVPSYDPNVLPFREEYEGRVRPPYTRATLPADNIQANIGVNHPISPPSEYIPFYGMPQRAGSKGPISPIRPDTSRSFNFENGLFANATLRTPGRNAGIFGRPPTTTQGSGPSTQNQATSRFKLTGGGLGAAGQPTTQQTPGTQSNLQGQPMPKQATTQAASSLQPNLQGQPMPVQGTTQATSSTHPTLQGQLIPAQPTLGGQSGAGYSSPLVEELAPDLQLNIQGQPTPEQSTSEWQPSTSGQPTSSTYANPQGQHTLGWQPSLQSPPNSDEVQEIPPPLSVSKAPKVKMAKQGPPKKRGPSNIKSSQPGKTPSTQRKPPKNKKDADQQSWAWLSSDFIWSLISLFIIFTCTLWYVLPAPTDEPDHISERLPRTNYSMPSFSIGTMLEKISNLLPEIPDMHAIPYDNTDNGPGGWGRPDNTGVNSDEILTNLKNRIPESIWVQGDKNGKLRIPEDFWHALRELIVKDDSILSLKNANISEGHWLAIKSRIQHAGLGVGASLKDMEALVQKKISQSWDSWLGQNDQALKTSTGTALAKDDFMKLVQEEIAAHSREISQEFTELQDRIKDITQQISQLQDEIGGAGGIRKDEITKTIDSLVSKTAINARIEAIAQGLIKGHANDVVSNQVNFFAIGAGASIDPEWSSPPWTVPKDFFKSKKWLDKDGYKAQPRMAALSPWNQEGECFCAGPDRKGYGEGTNNISVITSRNIIPQHLVVEHILPGATLDPGAMPREIEVWAYIEEVNLRNEARTFSETNFPDTPKEETLNEGFVKMGHFTYRNETYGDGVQVFKISDELKRMGAITDQVVVRAINNYGADHTCFYRLRLYGEVVERPDDPPAHNNDERRSWF